MCRHRVQFYDHDDFLVRKVVDFMGPALADGGSAVVIALPSHRQRIEALLSSDGAGGEAAGHPPGGLVCLDAHDTLAQFMIDGLPDEQRFVAVVGGLLARCGEGGRRVSAFGEMVAILYAEGNVEGAARLEHLWDGLFEHHAFNLLCAYPMSVFPDEAHRPAFRAICDAHSRVEPLESIEDAAADFDRLHGTIARLQQAANALEHELARGRERDHALRQQADRLGEMQRTQADLEHLAGRDTLTGLGNRRIFTDRLAQAFARARRTRSHLALLFVDLDAFKAVNDRFGHEAGDRLLKEVAARLSRCVRGGDTVCRLGGDEFTVILEDADADEAAVLAQRIVDALAETFVVGPHSIGVTASIGISLYPDDAPDAQALVRSADRAMYRAKPDGKKGPAAGQAAPAAAKGQHPPTGGMPDDGVTAWMTVEAAATHLELSRPHVAKLIAEKRFRNVVWQPNALPLIPSTEVSRVARELLHAGGG